MNSDTISRKKSALSTLLGHMDIPKMRRELTPSNIRWLGRNLGVRNGDHPMFPTARAMIIWLQRNDK
jgi:hypothetical protein